MNNDIIFYTFAHFVFMYYGFPSIFVFMFSTTKFSK
jgi:hypothetical protein